VACANGGQCVNNTCQGCAQTCLNGCCNGNTCEMPSVMSCGTGGAACLPCNGTLADGCTDGGCTCGGKAPCTAGQRCANGACVCDQNSCANGCCFGAACFPGVNCNTCLSFGKTCGQNTDCCSDNCVNGRCDVPAQACKVAGDGCAADGDCCSKHCDTDVDGKKRCSGPNQCKGLGAACAASNECCSLYCDPMTLLCSTAKQCVKANGACQSNAECCGNVCTNKVCTEPNGNCAILGETCASNNSCCSGVCLAGRCSFFNFCRAMGDICGADADCCDGVCDPNAHRCDSAQMCVTTNEPCTGLRSCCDTLCVPTGFGTSYCYPMCGCHAYDDVCTSDKQCCSGSCGAPDNLGLRRCARAQNCQPDGDVCGGNGASQNCCSGGKANCQKTGDGVSRCVPNFGMACFGAGHACSLCDSCCSNVCLPDANSVTGFSCAASCIPLNQGTCTADSDCCPGGVCQEGKCVPSGQGCAGLGAACQQNADCCLGTCIAGKCTFAQ
jgi:hypothetical protein